MVLAWMGWVWLVGRWENAILLTLRQLLRMEAREAMAREFEGCWGEWKTEDHEW